MRLPPLFEIDAPAVRAAFRVSFMTWMVGAICLGIFPNEGKSAEPLVPGADSSLGLGATNEAIRQVAPGLFQIGNVQAYSFIFGLGVVGLIWFLIFR